jgi:hypothetical protein
VVSIRLPAVDELTIGIRDDPWNPYFPPGTENDPGPAAGASATIPVSPRRQKIALVAKVMDKATGTMWRGAKVKLYGPDEGGGFELLDETTSKKGGDAVFRTAFPRSGTGKIEVSAEGSNGIPVDGTQAFVVKSMGTEYVTASRRTMRLSGGAYKPATGAGRRAAARAAAVQHFCSEFDALLGTGFALAFSAEAKRYLTLAREPGQSKALSDWATAAAAAVVQFAQSTPLVDHALFAALVKDTGFAPMATHWWCRGPTRCSPRKATSGTRSSSTSAASR